MSSLQIRVRFERPRQVVFRWFSARLRFAILTDQKGLERFVDSFVLFRAEGRETAFEKALSIGRQREQNYRNEENLAVRWRLASVISLDEIHEQNLNGVEVSSTTIEPHPADRDVFDWSYEFKPELSKPSQTC